MVYRGSHGVQSGGGDGDHPPALPHWLVWLQRGEVPVSQSQAARAL